MIATVVALINKAGMRSPACGERREDQMPSSGTITRFMLWALGALAIALVWLSLVSPPLWAATSTTIPLDVIRSGDCTGEDVQLSGTIHLVSQTQPDGSEVGHINYQNVSGVGLTSGTTYRASTVDTFRLEAPFPSDIHSVRSLRLISPGPEDDLLVMFLFHITVNANGEITAEIEDVNFECVG
jgi:hypothetical protein